MMCGMMVELEDADIKTLLVILVILIMIVFVFPWMLIVLFLGFIVWRVYKDLIAKRKQP